MSNINIAINIIIIFGATGIIASSLLLRYIMEVFKLPVLIAA
jgi:hypothetical protein